MSTYATRERILAAEAIEHRRLTKLEAATAAGNEVDEVLYAETYRRWAAWVDCRLEADCRALDADIEKPEHVSIKLAILARLADGVVDDVTGYLAKLRVQVADYAARAA